jgi:hypothetical protein
MAASGLPTPVGDDQPLSEIDTTVFIGTRSPVGTVELIRARDPPKLG